MGMSMPAKPAKPAALSGRIISAADGAPIRGAVVVIAVERHVFAETAPPVVVTSADDGRWLVHDVAPGSYVLTVSAIGFAPGTRDLLAIAAGEHRTDIDVSLDVGGILVAGTISSDARAPIANARVKAYRDGGRPYFIATSGNDGRYQLSLAAGPYQLEVSHDDYRRAWENISPAETPVNADFTLTRGGVIRGQVIARDTGKPVPDAMVTGFGGRDSSDLSVEAGPDGAFTLRGLHDGTITIVARGAGYASVTPTLVELGTGEHADDVRVNVDPAVSIVGRVVAKEDHARGIDGVMVNAMGMTDRMWLVNSVSDADGNYELVGMLPGKYMLSADKRGMLFEGGVQVEVVDADVTDVMIEMRTGATLSGRVDPPVGAQIAVARSGGDAFAAYDKDSVSIAKARTETDVRGAFTLRDVPGGDFEISAMAKDGKSGTLSVTVSGADQSGLVVRLAPRASVAGRVVDTNGRPVAGVYVFNSRIDVPLATRFKHDGIYRGATTAADGSFKIVGLEAGTWQMSVTEPKGGSNLAKVEVELPDGTDRTGVTLTVEARDAQIRGTILGADGKPAVGAQVRATQQVAKSGPVGFDSRGEAARTDTTGDFVIENLRPGTYTVFAEGPRGASKADKSGVKTGDSVLMTLAALSSLTVVVSQGGAPTAKVHVACWGPAGNLGLEAEIDGSHTFDDVAQGEWQCEAVGAKGTAKASIVVRGEPTTLALALEGFASLTGVAVNVLTGKPVARVRVIARVTSAETDASGRFVLEGVPAGTNDVVLIAKEQIGGGRDKYAYTAKPGERVDLGLLKVVPPRTGDVGTFGLGVEVRGDAVIVTRVKAGSPADQAGIKVGHSIATVDDQAVSELGLDRSQRLLASEGVGVGETRRLTLSNGTRATITAVKW